MPLLGALLLLIYFIHVSSCAKTKTVPIFNFQIFFLSIYIYSRNIHWSRSLLFPSRIEPTTWYPLYTHQPPSYVFTKYQHGWLSLGKTHTGRPPMQTAPALTRAHLQHVFTRMFPLQSLFNDALLTLNITINIMLWTCYQGVLAP